MKKFITQVGFSREKEDNWGICDKAEKLGFENSDDLVYLGYSIDMEVEVREDLGNRILKINDVDVSDKEIYI